MKQLYGPDDFLGLTSSTNPLSILSCDEAGPFYIRDQTGGYKTTYILACVEIITYKVHLIPLPKLDTLHFLRALEILQSVRGRFSTLILDDHTSHRPLSQAQHDEQQTRASLLEQVLDKGHESFLAGAGVRIVIASPKRHEKLGRVEFIVKRIKFFLASALKTWAFHDHFDFYHKISLMSLYMNERPIFHTPEGILTPYSLEQSMLKRSPLKPKLFTFKEFMVPSEKQVYKQILKMARFSKQVLFEVSTAAAFHLLNKKNLSNKFQLGELVYIPDRLLKKHPNSLRDALGKIVEVTNTTRDYVVETLDGERLKRHFSDLVNANVTTNKSEVMLIDPFQVIDYQTRIIPDHLYPKFRLRLDKFSNETDTVNENIPNQQDDTVNITETDDSPSGNERIREALESNNPSRTDKIIRKMIQNNKPQDIEIPPNLRGIKRPRSYNKRNDENRDKRRPRYEEPVSIHETVDDTVHNLSDHEPDHQPDDPQENEEYEAPHEVQEGDRINEDIQPPPEPQFELVQTAVRRSKRIPKLSAKKLCQFEHDEWHE